MNDCDATDRNWADGLIGATMNKAVPWSSGDSNLDIREAARRAAKREGLSVGEWLDAIIAERAEMLGVDVAKLDAEERVYAVTERLARLSGETRGASETRDSSEPSRSSLPPSSPRASERQKMTSGTRMRDWFGANGGATAPAKPSPTKTAAPTRGRSMPETARPFGPLNGRLGSTLDASAPTRAPIVAPRPIDVQAVATQAASDDGSSAAAEQSGAEELRRVEAKLTALFRALDRKQDPSGTDVVMPPSRPAATRAAAAVETAKMADSTPAPILSDAPPFRTLAQAIAEISERQIMLDRQAAVTADEPTAPPVSPQRAEEQADRKIDAQPHVTLSTRQDQSSDRRAKLMPTQKLAASRLRAEPSGSGAQSPGSSTEGSTLDLIERRLEALAAKIDMAIAGQVKPSVIETLSKRLDHVQGSLDDRLLSRTALPPLDQPAMEQMIEGLIGRIETLRQPVPDVAALEGMLQQLAQKLDDAREPQADAQVFGDLQAQVGKLAERIDKSDAGLTAIVSVERSLGELFSQLEETREAAINAAEGAARTAARDTLRAAMLDSALPFGKGHANAEAAVEQVSQELSDFRATRETSDQRLHAMLATLNETLEKVVDRLALPGVAETSVSAASQVGKAGQGATTDDASRVPPPGVRQAGERPRAALASLDADVPIEPGSVGNPRMLSRPAEASTDAARAPDVKADPSQFIAAARRAALAAAQDTAACAATAATRRGDHQAQRLGSSTSLMDRVKDFSAKHRRPMLLSLAGLVLLLGAIQVARLSAVPADGASTVGSATAANVAEPQPSSTGAIPAVKREALAGAAGDAAVGGPAATVALVPPAPAVADQPKTAVVAPAKSLPTLAMGRPPLSGPQPSPTASGLRDLASSGNAAAQFELGLRLADGRGLPRDPKQAAEWLEKAATQGLAPAAYRLGSLYEKGLGVPRDPAISSRWYQQAAEQGNIRAMHNLAVMSAEGAGGKPDYPKAATWFGKASQMGVRDSQFNLAILYARGLGIEQSLAQSYTWFAIAAAQGDDDAARKRDDVAAKLDAKTLAAAKAAAENFRPTPPIAAANEVPPPAAGWDAVQPQGPVPTTSNVPAAHAPAPNASGSTQPGASSRSGTLAPRISRL
ncbi:SEL1-like repeat protein [Lichenihabitans psoromatis]|uniref:SEL1-like repeat protein n=1 Tax=Lichenihabitans psoromatis TaxID=2528642 RepID=UPI0013F176D6|nr:SEL1-like repeat protein [Lichenihabitans psoromatis]